MSPCSYLAFWQLRCHLTDGSGQSVSPSSISSHLSPKPSVPNPNLNPFSPLSPHLLESRLDNGHGDEEMNDIMGLSDRGLSDRGEDRVDELRRRKMGPVIYYTRRRLLKIGQRCADKGYEAPNEMGGLESWYG